MGFMEGKSAKEVGMKFRESSRSPSDFMLLSNLKSLSSKFRTEDMFVPAMIANWKVWPAAQVRGPVPLRSSRDF